MKIAEVSSEIYPYAKTGGLADVIGTLPLYLEKTGHEVLMFMPFYKSVKRSGFNIKRVGCDFDISVGSDVHKGYLWECHHPGSEHINVYFIQCDEYYHRDSLYGTTGIGDYPDNSERFIFFSRAVIESIKELGLSIDVIHCHDWQSALIPVYVKTLYAYEKSISQMRTMLTIHNLSFQGQFPAEDMKLTGLEMFLFNPSQLEHWDKVNFLKGGIVFADIITTVSRKYAEEIRTEEFGCGLEDVLRENESKLYGIINGVDYSQWSPENDKHILHKYSVNDLRGKVLCKNSLRRRLGLPRIKGPVLSMISRLTEQKGVDLLIVIMDELMKRDIQLVILGIGEEKFHQMLMEMAERYKQKLSVNIMYDNQLAHQIEAGSDIFLMPSKFEPCGLTQMYSLRYGTIPVVREIGGLADTIIDANEKCLKDHTATGFTHKGYFATELLNTIDRALELYKSKIKWNALRKNAMKQDWSWKKSACEYIDLLKSVCEVEYAA